MKIERCAAPGGWGCVLLLILARLLVRSRTAHPAPARDRHSCLLAGLGPHRLFMVLDRHGRAAGIVMVLQTRACRKSFSGLPRDSAIAFWVYPSAHVHYLAFAVLIGLDCI